MSVYGTNPIVDDDPHDNDDPDQEAISEVEEKSKNLVERALQPDFSKALETAITYCSENREKLHCGEKTYFFQFNELFV
jgi:hypothetical protein